MKNLIVATGNPGKLQEMQEYLIGLNWKLKLKPPEIEIEETGQTFRENAILKASQVAKGLGEWAIADDSGLAVAALNGAPGLYSARYGATDEERINRLLRELGENENRKAEFICAIAIASPDGSIALETQGICPGEILKTPQGSQGFGYDPIFYVPQHQQTFAQMTPKLKRDISHRGKAFALLLPQFKKIYP
ncbi:MULTISPECIES: RdgB/HAM1 family non-canonical purine NTP pyrophosphatase [Crocosphaera]|uniref:dITP/XTP pyrophosphatase n=4 Tax=Crocosphaera watsonii TaxID=263511 RepID=T2JRR4_CROWT|nr:MULTISPECIES: RdgB/HAM1 family non-canonical purine NTP pyrophosphatase [Crocosphaera]EHJ12754.1 Xanthosine/inosine triphosphate pyrophosphatase [Crocosphaera watsonii WH 0003]MCH2245857.1 RdgB/HAM1 family non-canonical purine NTP pyrophosphatase [Crocosphaera sp.]CCQ58362.1 Xanthosine/inosine triphosphate pyrophosphatase [Crocosphaera watsonii WH 0005]CCQ68553.1 Xanthosine/inosine triphosphate pyrophosphatase [Crocosphaera watsonii WH 0402]